MQVAPGITMKQKQYGLSWIDIPEQYDIPDVTKNIHLKSVHKKDICGINGTVPHLFIEGDNYPALCCLLRTYTASIDLIYIDPPYNTGNGSFTYDDSRFLVQLPDGTHIPCSNPARHSAWLSFMERRLIVARSLLSDSGCIFISISEDEYSRLRLLCDGIFGEENFVNNFMYLHGKGKKNRWSRTMQQSTVCYAKVRNKLGPFSIVKKTDWAKTNTDNDPRGLWFSASISFSETRSNPRHTQYFSVSSPSGIVWTRQWLYTRQEMDTMIAEKRIYFGPGPQYENVPRRKVFNGEECQIIPPNIISCADSTRSAQSYLDNILGVKNAFINPKPVNLVSYLLDMTQMQKNATVLDFFAGSGTTLEAVLRMNNADGGKRRCILIQSAEPCRNTDKNFSSVADIAYERCRRIMQGYTENTGTIIPGLGGSLLYYCISSQ